MMTGLLAFACLSLAHVSDRDAARARMESSPGTRAALDAAAKEVERTLRRSAYRWVNLRTLFGAAGMA